MRWSDLYLGLMAATFGFGAVVGWTAGMSSLAVGGFLAATAGFLILMAYRATHTQQVVLVGDPGEDRSFDLQWTLDNAGFAVRSCVGPANRPCPVLEGKDCPIGGHPVAAVVRIPVNYAGPAAPCARGLGVPMLEVHEVADADFAAGTLDRLSPIGDPEDVVSVLQRRTA